MRQETKFLFVGERPSPRAAAVGATWRNGKLCAKNLHDALLVNNIDPTKCEFVNLWETPGLGACEEEPYLWPIRSGLAVGMTIVALGNLVSRELIRAELPHLKLIHPAARGTIRRTENYRAHVGMVLRGVQP
jgi:hypothetical protein